MMLIGAMMALYQLCYMSAVRYAGVTVAVLVTLCVAPVIVALVSALWLHEPLTRRIGAAMVAALGGTVLLIGLQPGEPADANVVLGATLALGSATAYAVVTLASRALAPRYHPAAAGDRLCVWCSRAAGCRLGCGFGSCLSFARLGCVAMARIGANSACVCALPGGIEAYTSDGGKHRRAG